MQRKRYAVFIIGGVVILLIIVVITSYNTLVKKEERVKQQWSEVQNTYQRRLDLLPSLINVVKGVSGFESGTLEAIASARSNAQNASSATDATGDNYNRQENLQDTVAAVTNRLIAVVEDYPTLKGTAAYSGLQTQIEGTERRIKVARKDFNEAVNDYNQKVRSFPTSVVARLFGFKRREGFTAQTGADQPVEINFAK
jgi:LemA protein